MPDKRKHSDSPSAVDLATPDDPPPFPTTSRELRPRSQPRALSSSVARTRAHSKRSASNSASVSRPTPDASETSGSRSRQSPDMGSLVIESTLAEYMDAAEQDQLDMEPSSDVVEVSYAQTSDGRKRQRVETQPHDDVDANDGGRRHSHPPIAYFSSPPLNEGSSLSVIRDVVSRGKHQASSSSSQANPSSSFQYLDSDPFTESTHPPTPSTSNLPPLASTSTLADPISSSSKQSNSLPASLSTSYPSSAPSPSTAQPLTSYTCPICFSPPTNATLTPCGHVCCGVCLFTAVKATMQRGATMMGGEGNFPRCPVCRARIPDWDGRGGGVIGLTPRAIFLV